MILDKSSYDKTQFFRCHITNLTLITIIHCLDLTKQIGMWFCSWFSNSMSKIVIVTGYSINGFFFKLRKWDKIEFEQ